MAAIPAAPKLHPGEVHIWQGDVDQLPGVLDDLAQLSQSERDRLTRFREGAARDVFATSHISLRQVLARYLRRRPDAISFTRTDGGKPAVINGMGLRFNLSHSHQRWVIAITRDCEVGVDLEYHRRRVRYEQVADRYFAIEEQRALAACPRAARPQMFTRIWTLKEAYIKAVGLGLAHPLDGFSVCPPGPNPGLSRSSAGSAKDWTLRNWHPAPDYTAAVALPCRAAKLRYFDLFTPVAEIEPGSLSCTQHSGRP